MIYPQRQTMAETCGNGRRGRAHRARRSDQ